MRIFFVQCVFEEVSTSSGLAGQIKPVRREVVGEAHRPPIRGSLSSLGKTKVSI
ncbi:hypothetical protein KIS4809_1006 [Bacillus sp. ZZV12-4809]|nr:hypothetical protein KIS4809_1006 [Bacillus sp. ZZV12-4809]